jgi:hypothetical protein
MLRKNFPQCQNSNMAADRSWKGLKLAILSALLDHEYFFATRTAILLSIEPDEMNDYGRAVCRFAGVPEPPSIRDELHAFCAEWDIEFEFSRPPSFDGVRFSRGGPDWPAWALRKAQAQASKS